MGTMKPSAPLVPETETEPDQDMPPLELVDYTAVRKSQKKLPGGAHNPYERQPPTGDTVRVQRPRIDLRQLSKWITIKKEVDALRAQGDRPSPDKTRKR
jgi:hypothetical protein